MSPLEITKYNYEGYIKLLKEKMNNSIIDDNYIKNNVRQIIIKYSMIMIPLISLTFVCNMVLPLDIIIIGTSLGIVYLIYYYSNVNSKSKKILQSIKQEYPYVENYNFDDLVEALKKVQILDVSSNDEIIFNVRKFEYNTQIKEAKKELHMNLNYNFDTKEKIKIKTKQYRNKVK